jgi:Uma2 family endonuclease
MATSLRWTVADLEFLPDNGTRYEIVDGELLMSSQPSYAHQRVCVNLAVLFDEWSTVTKAGEVNLAPGVIFSESDAVAPDVIWISWQRLAEARRPNDGHLYAPPELVVEVLSPGTSNEERDREVKLKLYSARGIDEYWIVDWRNQTIAIYRRQGPALAHAVTLASADQLTSPLFPGCSRQVSSVFRNVHS